MTPHRTVRRRKVKFNGSYYKTGRGVLGKPWLRGAPRRSLSRIITKRALLATYCLMAAITVCGGLSSIAAKSDAAQTQVAKATDNSGPQIRAAQPGELDPSLLGAASIPIAASRHRRPRVVIYARYSSEEQDASSIPDQIEYCKEFLKTIGITDAIITVFSDEAYSGELRSRPGIDPIWAGIDVPKWDLLICEDCSRLFRKETACREMVEIAFDAGMRFIAINDDVDTTKEGWETRLKEAASEHERSNLFLKRRIHRKLIALWKMKAAVVILRPGYKRIPSVPASMGERAKGPFLDEVDEAWRQVIYECFARVANGEPLWLVAKWLTSTNLPRYGNSRQKKWTEAAVIAMIRQTVYRGLDRHRVQVTTKKRHTGKKQTNWNEDECWSCEMEHLRMVPDALWYRANKAIDDRNLRKSNPRGLANPSYGIPRNSHGPLSDDVFICECCKHKMTREGRIQGGYCCSRVEQNDCWNKATALQELAHETIGRVIGERLHVLSSIIDVMVRNVKCGFADGGQRQRRIAEIEDQMQSLHNKQDRLMKIAESTDDEPPEILAVKLKEIELLLAEHVAELVEMKQLATDHKPGVIRNRIVDALGTHSERIAAMGREAAATLKQLVPDKIRAVPYQQFGSNKVVLRAEFVLRLVNVVPTNMRDALTGITSETPAWAQPIEITLNLFTPTLVPANALWASELRPFLTLEETGEVLGISKRVAHLAAELGDKMQAAGITDPYIRITEPPANASRWRTHKKFLTQRSAEVGEAWRGVSSRSADANQRV